MKKKIVIVGNGIAGIFVGYILVSKGYEVKILEVFPKQRPILILNMITINLIRQIMRTDQDIFGHTDVIPLRKVILPNQRNRTITLNQPSVVITEDLLINSIKSLVIKNNIPISFEDLNSSSSKIKQGDTKEFDYDWIINTSGKLSAINDQQKVKTFRSETQGSRHILSTTMSIEKSENSTFMEFVPEGWVFWAPLNKQRILVQVMVPEINPDPVSIFKDQISQTTILKHKSICLTEPINKFQASCRMSPNLIGNSWISVGEAAVSFDPISGNGVNYAIKGAILASAVIDGIEKGLAMDSCIEYYKLRIRLTFLKHLTECIKYYSTQFSSSTKWNMEITSMRKLFSSISSKYTIENGKLNFRICEFDLVSM